MIANDDETEIAFSGKVTLDGLPPSAGGVTRIAGGRDPYGAECDIGVALRGVEVFGGAGVGLTAVAGREDSDSGLDGGAFRASSPFEPLGFGLLSGLVGG